MKVGGTFDLKLPYDFVAGGELKAKLVIKYKDLWAQVDAVSGEVKHSTVGMCNRL